MVSDRTRAVSTVADVALALVLLSAAVVMMGVYLQDSPDPHDPLTADRTGETVAGMTVETNYDISEIKGSTDDIDWSEQDGALQQSKHDTVGSLLADAAIANASYDGERTTITGEIFREAIDGRFRTRIAGADTNVHVTAVWRPYDGSSIEGVASVGPRPPGDADVSSVTLTVPSGISLNHDYSTLQSEGEDRAELLANRIVAHHFPLNESFISVESQGVRRDVTVYRYLGFLEVTGHDASEYLYTDGENGAESDDDDDTEDSGEYGPLTRPGADPGTVNEDIADGLAAIMRDEQRTDFDSDEEFAEWLSIDDVEVIVQTWHA